MPGLLFFLPCVLNDKFEDVIVVALDVRDPNKETLVSREDGTAIALGCELIIFLLEHDNLVAEAFANNSEREIAEDLTETPFYCFLLPHIESQGGA